MYKTMIAGVTALSLTFASAQPAQANGFSDEDVGKLLFGLIATYAIGSAIKNHNDRSRSEPQQVERAAPVHQGWVHRPNRNVLPRQCLQRVGTNFGEHRIFNRRCLRQEYAFVSDLPRRCAVRLFTNRGPVRGYDPRCLRESGYRARRH